jgi:parallel beta-helix repeat protein
MLNIFILLLLACVSGFAATGGGGGGAPNVVTISPGANLATYNFQSSNAYYFGKGNYTPGTPSLLQSNLNRSTTFTGILKSNLSQVSFIGVPGQTVINGRGSLGDSALFLQCTGLYFYGITFLGYTNHNILQLPEMGTGTNTGAYLGAIVNLAACEDIVFENCVFDGSWDHGLLDFAANNSGYPYGNIMSKRVKLINCRYRDIGGFRRAGGANTSWDGTCVIPGAWDADGCVFEDSLRAWEPYDEGDPGEKRFFGATLRNSTIRNMNVGGVLTAGTTNAVDSRVINCAFTNQLGWTYHGSNYTVADEHGAIDWRASDGLIAIGNTIDGVWGSGIFGYGFTRGEIRNNTIRHLTNVAGVNAIGIKLQGTTNVIVSGNTILAPKTYGMYLYGTKDSVVENNDIRDPGLGTGILIATFAPFTASNNFIRNNFIKATTGISDQLGGLLPQYIFNNEIVATTKISNLSGDNMQVEGPPRVWNYTNDFPSIAAGGSFRTNFPAPGARTNDFGYLMTPDQFFRLGTNVFPYGWASNDTFWIWVQNVGPAASDPGSVRFKGMVKQVEAY